MQIFRFAMLNGNSLSVYLRPAQRTQCTGLDIVNRWPSARNPRNNATSTGVGEPLPYAKHAIALIAIGVLYLRINIQWKSVLLGELAPVAVFNIESQAAQHPTKSYGSDSQ